LVLVTNYGLKLRKGSFFSLQVSDHFVEHGDEAVIFAAGAFAFAEL
jgi:hypothetical protein